ncbi:hypothetical protein BGZ99_002895 [Dissophora globulifera]|uniref:Uncharacterized protein n=1 Tax=Dissophora globulifera TaxID=979702 RepID=A0A9P6RMS2_9FUNG|nr:hypothetical protein BGZ99_002895 [Dissophora globulifera]
MLHLDELSWPAEIGSTTQGQLAAQATWIPDQEVTKLLSNLHVGLKGESDNPVYAACQALVDVPIETFGGDLELKGHDIVLKSYDPNVHLSIKISSSSDVSKPSLRAVRGQFTTLSGPKGLMFKTKHHKSVVTVNVWPVSRHSQQDQECLRSGKRGDHEHERHSSQGAENEKQSVRTLNGRKESRYEKRHNRRHHHDNQKHQHKQDHRHHRHGHHEEDRQDPVHRKPCHQEQPTCRYVPIYDQDPVSLFDPTSSEALWESNLCPIILDLEILIPRHPDPTELCSLQLEGAIMDVRLEDAHTNFKKVHIANQHGKIVIKDLRTDLLNVYSMLSDIQVLSVQSGHDKKLEVSAVSPVGAIQVQVAKAPTSKLCLTAISGRGDVDVVLPKAYAGQVVLKTPTYKSLIVEKVEPVRDRKNQPRLRNGVRLESKGDATHARLSYH